MGKRLKFKAIAAYVLTALILLCAGLFLFLVAKVNGAGSKHAVNGTIPVSSDVKNSVKYVHISKIINDKKQEINILEVNPAASGVRILPALSHDLVYGYEYLSSIAERKNAYAAVNAGFFFDYGLPSGMVAADGNILTLPTGKFPVFSVSGGKAALGGYKLDMRLNSGGSGIRADRLNMPAGTWECAVYTPAYGSTNRVKGENYTVMVQEGKVVSAGFRQDQSEIPSNGMLVTIKTDGNGVDAARKVNYSSILKLEKGDTLELTAAEPVPVGLQAYECGSWIVQDGKVVTGEKDAWTGVTTNNDPRTAIGLKKDGIVILITVDGRQPGYSEGMTFRELGEFLLEYGVENAAMLDGGASTEMIFNGKIVNKPSFKGQERPVGGGIVVIADID